MKFKQIQKLIRKTLQELEIEVLTEEPNISDESLKEVLRLAKEKFLTEMGILDWYLEQEKGIKEWSKYKKKEKRDEITAEIQQAKEEVLKVIPPDKEIPAPQIINKIVKEITKPVTIIKPEVRTEVRTQKIVKELDRTELEKTRQEIITLQEDLQTLWDNVGKIKIPEPVDLEAFRQIINKDSADVINKVVERMPNFRALAMGLQGQIDELKTDLNFENLWDRTGTDLSPHTTGDSVTLGTGNLTATSVIETTPTLLKLNQSTAQTVTASPVMNWLTASKPVFTDANKKLVSTGTLGADQGGTGQSTYAVGDLLYASGATALSKLADVAVASYLRSGGVTTAPLWSTLKLPNAATSKCLTYATSTNTLGENAKLTYGKLWSGVLDVDDGGFLFGKATTEFGDNWGLLGRSGDNLGFLQRWEEGDVPIFSLNTAGSYVTTGWDFKPLDVIITDSYKIYLGTGKDASFNYNGTNLIINPKEVGTGFVDIQGTTQVDKLEVDDANTYIDKDGSNNMTFTDAVSGTLTLAELSCPPKVEATATGVAEGNANVTGLGGSKVLIKWIKVTTTSTNWTLTIYTKDDYATKSMEIITARNGNYDLYFDYPYEDEDATSEFHYNFASGSGSETHNITILGYKLR